MLLLKQMSALVILLSILAYSLSDNFTDVNKRTESVITATTKTTLSSGQMHQNTAMSGSTKTESGGQMSFPTSSNSGIFQRTSKFKLITKSSDGVHGTLESKITKTDVIRQSNDESPSTTASAIMYPQSYHQSLSTSSRNKYNSLSVMSGTVDPESKFQSGPSTGINTHPRDKYQSLSATQSTTISPERKYQLLSTTSGRPQLQKKGESQSTTNINTDPQKTFDSSSITIRRTTARHSKIDMTSTSNSIHSQHMSSTPESVRWTTVTTSNPVHNTPALSNVTTAGEDISNQTVPCPRMCVCNQMSALEKLILENRKVFGPGITEKNIWQKMGKLTPNPSYIAVLKQHTFKDVTCHVNENEELLVDSEFRRQSFGSGFGSYNNTFICSNGGKLLVSNVDAFLDSAFVSIVNCSVRTDGYIRSEVSHVKMVSVIVDNSSLHWLNNVTISNTNSLTILHIFNTPLNGYPRIVNQTKMQLQKVYFKYNNMVNTNCSFFMGFWKSVTSISITHNNLSHIPACLLTSVVTSLVLSNNKLENISALLYPRIVPTTNLFDLWLDHNSITNIGVFSYMNISLLDLSYNKIQHLNKLTFNRLPQLTYLDLSWNMITTIPAGTFKAFFYLVYLNLSHNAIRDFSYLQSPMSAADINIHDNLLVYPPFHRDAYKVKVKHTVKAENNPYQCDCESELFKKYILQSGTGSKYKLQFKHLDKYLCTKPKSLYNQSLMNLNVSDVCSVVTGCPESCECWLNKTTNVTEIRCSNLNMTSLPAVVPEGKVVLLFSGNNISNVTTRGYFTRTEKLDLSRNALKQVGSSVCELWKHIQTVDISVNKIRYLPKCFEKFNLSALTLHMHGNPWMCDCNSMWMITWFKHNKQYIPEYERTMCGNAEFRRISLGSFATSELDCNPKSYLKVVSSLGFLVLLALVLVPLAYKFRFQTQVFIHAQFHVRPFDRMKLENVEDYKYDVFLSYASQNEGWVVHTLMPRLETRDRPYRVCVHYKDFEVGAAIADNILNAVEKSRCTVMILSKDYAASEWCLFEFQKAHHEVLKDRTRKLVVILYEDVLVENIFPELQVYLKQNTYLRLDDRWFWQKLFYCLPDPLNKNLNQNQQQNLNGFENDHMHELNNLQ